ncbi:MAG: hypothetical protein H6810_07215 [Phycisphaeraceae bacterium]|nr:MAG: hypothetical protein H6810_07215 [Phycisphaeraceae bacterium]
MAAGTAIKRWLMIGAGLALVGLGLWLVWPEGVRGAWEWIVDHPGVVTTVAGLAAVIVGFKLIRRGMKKSG